MHSIHEEQILEIPENVKVHIKARKVTVEGPRGKLFKNFSHISILFSKPANKNIIKIELHHGLKKKIAALGTVRSLIENMFVGVTKGYKYKMRYVYAHFPINVKYTQSNDTNLFDVEIRNFLGEKIVRHVTMRSGVHLEETKNVKDELQLTGNDLDNVSQSAADLQQACRVRHKDIRKFLDGLYVSEKGNIDE